MKKTNVVFSSLAMVFAGFVFFVTRAWPKSKDGVPGPAVFPRIVAGIILCCSVAVLVRTLLSKDDGSGTSYGTRDQLRVYMTMGALFVYFILMRYLGFIIDSAIMLTCFFAWFSRKRLWQCVIIAIASSLVIYLVFAKCLNVSMRFGLLYF